MTDKPRIGDPAPEDLFDPLDAIDVLLGTMPTSETGAVTLTGEDLQTVCGFLRKARAERRVRQRAFRDALRQRNEAQQGWAASLAEKMCEPPAWRPEPIAEDIEVIPGPGGSRVLVGKGINATDALEKLKALGELTDRGLGRVEQAIERMSDETRGRLDKTEKAIGAVADEAGGRIATLEVQTEQHRRSIWQVASDLKDLKDLFALAKRLEEAEADHSRLQSRVVKLEAQAGAQQERIEWLETVVARLTNPRPGPEEAGA